MQFFLAEWRGPFPENVPLTLGHLRRELGLPEAMVAREEDGGLLLLSSRNPTLTEERLTQALRRALPLPGDSPEQVSILKDLHACKTFLMYVSGLAETEVAADEGYLASLHAKSVGQAITKLFSIGVQLRPRTRPYLELKRRDAGIEAFVVELTRKIFGTLSRTGIYLLGCSPDALAIAGKLREDGPSYILVSSTDTEACTEAARSLSAKCTPPGLAPDKVVRADIIICSEPDCCLSLRTHHFMIASSRRNGVPLLVLDVSPERCIDSSIAKLDGVVLYDRTQLFRELSARSKCWAEQLVQAADMIHREAQDFTAQVQHDSADKVIEALHSLSERIARKELLKLQPTLERLDIRNRKTIADTITRTARGTVATLTRAFHRASSKTDLMNTLKQALEEGGGEEADTVISDNKGE